MNVTREVVKDLLPLYVAGEASADTRALVEAFLGHDPELERWAEALRSGESSPARGVSVEPGSGHVALARTKILLRRRTRLLAFAILFTGLPLTSAFDQTGLRFLLLRDAPALASASLAVALALWIAYAVTARRLRVSGL